jgi:RNA polymerase sigma factor (sigma-70 family)
MLLVEDRSLLEAFRRGDKHALEKVYLTFAPAVAGLLRGGFSFNSTGHSYRFRGTRSQFDLEDRLHDVFARAFAERARMGYDGLSPYKNYLLTIARNVVIDDFRRKETVLVEFAFDEEEHRGTTAPAQDHAAEPLLGHFEPSGNPTIDAESKEVVDLVQRFRESLSEREREIFRLRFEEEKEHREIAESTGLSPSKIKTSEQRIRERFFEYMNSRGYFQGYQRARRGWLAAIFSLAMG